LIETLEGQLQEVGKEREMTVARHMEQVERLKKDRRRLDELVTLKEAQLGQFQNLLR
jgi:hypothetical protein